MSGVLSLPPTIQSFEIEADFSHSGYSSFSSTTPSASVLAEPKRRKPTLADIQKQVLDAHYSHIVKRRLRSIELPSPFPPDLIEKRLRYLDGLDPNSLAQRDRIMALTAKLAVRAAGVEVDEPGSESRLRGRVSRLYDLWEVLELAAARYEETKKARGSNWGYLLYRFFHSDLDPAIVCDLGPSYDWEMASTGAVNDSEGKALVRAIAGIDQETATRDEFLGSKLSPKSIEQHFREYVVHTQAIANLADEVLDRREAVLLYIDLWSAASLEEFRSRRNIDMSKLDRRVLDTLLTEVREATLRLRKSLFDGYSRVLGGLRFSPLSTRIARDVLLEPWSAE
jgi:hypothetical protein